MNPAKLIVRRLITHGDNVWKGRRTTVSFTNDPKIDAVLGDIDSYPHLFVLGCVLDSQVHANRAWIVPYNVGLKNGGFLLESMSRMRESSLARIFREGGSHRYPNIMAKRYHLACRHLIDEYGSDASRIWRDRPSSGLVVSRFLAMHGVGPKIATMATNILAREFKVRFSDYSSIDISVDRLVRRVFKRLGLASDEASDLEITYRARAFHPAYPGLMDLALWKIGMSWCRETIPLCSGCCMNDVCPTSTT